MWARLQLSMPSDPHEQELCTGVYSALEWYEPELYGADNHFLALALLRDDLFRV